MGLSASTTDALVGAGMIWLLHRSKDHVVRLRYLGIVSDNTALTLGMAGAGEGGVALFGVYLWVTIGNGFRFGPRYLLASYWLTLIGFGFQLIFVPFWAQHRAVGVGLMLAAAIVPLYVLVLLIRLRGQKEDAEQLSSAKSRFVANVSHELRTPLTGVFAVYDLLKARRMTPDDRELVGMLGSAVQTLKASVDAVLQMSKLEAGAERAENRLFNLWFLLQQLGTLVRPQSAAKGLAWHLQVDPAVPSTVLGDPAHLSHVLGNLLNNAFKFTAAGSVSLRAFPSGNGYVRFEVTDTGIGIPLDQQERLFERFVQVDSSATRRHGGTGLGTSIARDLTELMGGKIGVVSAPGQGSTFWIDLPLPETDTSAEATDWGSLHQVLIIGEAGILRDEMAATVHALGLEPVVAAPALEAAPDFGDQGLLAAILLMHAADAATYAETVLHGHTGVLCPWLVIAPSYSEMQRASLMRNGAAGLLRATARVETLRLNLASLMYRLELPVSSETQLRASRGVMRPLRILLADDNRSNQLLLSRILKDAGHTVQTAERGDQAFDLMAVGDLDLAILDLNMPDMSGPDVVKMFRASSVGGDRLPIMILSADATPAAKQDSIDAGANEFLTKPVTAGLMLAAIERIVAGYGARVSAQEPQPASAPKQRSGAASGLVDPDRIQALRRIARGDAKFLDAYISAAFVDLERALGDLSMATESNNIRSARDALHIIEGTGASVGATALVENCKSVRHYFTAPYDPDRASALAELSTTYALTKSTLQANLHELRARALRHGTGHSNDAV
jgi:two-component system sensor histidine kinase RpfC